MGRLLRMSLGWRLLASIAVVLILCSFPHMRVVSSPVIEERVLPDEEAVINRVETPPTAKVKPNIIVLLSEAFWDPTLLPGVAFNRDPIPFFRQLRQSFTGGWLQSPQHGGGTANVEYEVLTGNPARVYGEYDIAYRHIEHPVDSIAWMAVREGYRATAISPFYHHFENSSSLYPHLGFSQFISMEFFPPDYSGPYLANRSVVHKIIEETQETAGPDFVFANTMENHHHFYPGKFSEANPFHIKADMSAASVGILETLSMGLSKADAALQELVAYFSESKEPTLILFFGDHQPALEADYGIYREAGYVTADDPETWKKMYTTPFVIWDNYLPLNKQDLNVNAYLLLPELIRRGNLQPNDYSDYLQKFAQELPVVPRNPADAGLSPEDPRLLELEDKLATRLDELQGPYVDEVRGSYVHGYADLAITEAKLEPKAGLSGETVLTVYGKHFGLGCELLLNGKPIATVWQPTPASSAATEPTEAAPGSADQDQDRYRNDDGVLTSVLSAKQLKQAEQAGELSLQVRVMDNKQKELYRSQAHIIPKQ